MIRYRLRFAKEIEFSKSFINSIDIVKKILISNFELYISNKKHKFSCGPALPYGWASECEYLDVFFVKREDEKFITEVINKNLPTGIKLLEVKTIPAYFPSIESAADIVEILIEGEKRFIDSIVDSTYCNVIYDVIKQDDKITLFIFYKKIFRDLLKIIVDFISFGGKIKRITRRNIYWFDSLKRLRTF